MILRMERRMLLEISLRVGVLSSRGVSKQASRVLYLMYLKVDIMRGD